MTTKERVLSDQELTRTCVLSESTPTLTPYRKAPEPVLPTPSISSWAKDQLSPILHVEKNWDGYQAHAPSRDAVLMAADLLTSIEKNFGKHPPILAPTRTGGVLLIWTKCDRELEIQINHDKTFSFVYESESKPISAIVSPQEDNLQLFLRTVWAFFRKG